MSVTDPSGKSRLVTERDERVDIIARRLHIEDSVGWWGPGTNWRTLDRAGRQKYRVVAHRILGDLGSNSRRLPRPLNHIAEVQATEVERIWPTPEGQDPVLRQVAALTEEVGEIARAVLKRSHASRSATGTHKGLSVDEWTEEVALEIGQALGVLLGLGHQEGVDLDDRMATTLRALEDRPSILTPAANGRTLGEAENGR